MKKTLSLLLALVMALALVPAVGVVTASAATGAVTIDIGTLGATDQNNSANVATESQWHYVASTKVLFLDTTGGNYTLTGTNGDMALAGTGDKNVTLSGVNMIRPSSVPLSLSSSGCIITLIGTNALSGGSGVGFHLNPGISCTIKGSGNLTVTGGGGGWTGATIAGTLSILENAAVTAIGTAGRVGLSLPTGGSVLIGDNAKLTITNKSASAETHTFAKADVATTHSWKLTNASTTDPLTNASITISIAAGATATIEREPIPVAPAITTASLPGGTVGTAYSQTLAATGTAPITWSISAGALPAGLSLNTATGAITGTPTAAGTANFTVKAANGVSPDATKALSIIVSKAPRGIFGTNPKWTAWWAYLLFFLCFGFIWMWF